MRTMKEFIDKMDHEGGLEGMIYYCTLPTDFEDKMFADKFNRMSRDFDMLTAMVDDYVDEHPEEFE